MSSLINKIFARQPISIDNIDLDDLRQTGLYFARNNVANTPDSGSFFYIIHFGWPHFDVQFAIAWLNTSNIYYRCSRDGHVWESSGWHKISVV